MKARDKELDRIRATAWNNANKDRVKRNQRAYSIKNRDILRKRASEYGKAHKEANRSRVKAFKAARPWYEHWVAARRRCNSPKATSYAFYGGKGIKCLLSKFDVQFMWNRDNAADMNIPTIDRIDPKGDYILDNCRFMEKWENSMRAALTRHHGEWGKMPQCGAERTFCDAPTEQFLCQQAQEAGREEIERWLDSNSDQS